MMPKNLRTVVAQVAHVRKSVALRRNFCSSPNPTTGNVLSCCPLPTAGKSVGSVVTATLNRHLESASKMRLGGAAYFGLGYCGFGIWELIRLGEYRRACEKVLESEGGVAKSSMRLWLER